MTRPEEKTILVVDDDDGLDPHKRDLAWPADIAAALGLSRESGLQEAVEEMRHADELISRILFLEGLPNLQDLGKLYIGQDVKEILECDLKLELEAIPMLREAIAHCEQAGDYVSRRVFRDILASEEEHVDWIETQLDLIAKTGIENYIQSQMQG